MKVAIEAFVRLEMGLGRTGCREWRRRRGCCGDGHGGGNDEGGFAEGETDSPGRKIAGLVDCVQAAVEEAIGQHALCSCFEPKLERQNERFLWLERSRSGSLLIALGAGGRSSIQIECGSRR